MNPRLAEAKFTRKSRAPVARFPFAPFAPLCSPLLPFAPLCPLCSLCSLCSLTAMSNLLNQIKHQYARLTGALDEDPRIALHRKTRRKIKELNYPLPHGFHDQYRHHLDRLNVADLHDFIAWIPYERFQDLQLLSKGTLATVYTAILPSTRDEGFAIVKKGELHSFDGRKEKRVALKEMDDELIQELVASEIFVCNAEWPLTMELIGLTQDPSTGRYLVVTDQASDGNLTTYLSTHPPRNWDEVYRHIFALAKRLASLHHLGVLHGNLHAGNVVFDKDEPYLIDIGVIKVNGAPRVQPPEIVQGGQYGAPTDVYYFGILAWQIMAGGARPQVTSASNRLPEEHIPGSPHGLWTIVQGCWHPDPDERLTMQQVCGRVYYWHLGREWTGGKRWSVIGDQTLEYIKKRKEEDEKEGEAVVVGGADVMDSFIHVTTEGALSTSQVRELNLVHKAPSGRHLRTPLLIPVCPNLNLVIRRLLPNNRRARQLTSLLLFPFVSALICPFGYANANTFFPRHLIPNAPFPDPSHADHVTVHHTLPAEYLASTPGPRISYTVGISVYLAAIKASIPRNEMAPTAELLVLDFVHGLRRPAKRYVDAGTRVLMLYLKWRLLGLVFERYRIFDMPMHGDKKSLDLLIIGIVAALAHGAVGEVLKVLLTW